MKRISKALGALLGGVTGAAVLTVAHALGLSIDPTLAASVAAILAALGGYLAPKNEEVK